MTSVLALVLPALFQADAWSPTSAFGAYLRAIEIMHCPMPAMVEGSELQSVELAALTAAGSVVGSPASRT